MDSEINEALERDQEALNNYQESRKRQRSDSGSPLSDIDEARIKKEKINDNSQQKPVTDSLCKNDPMGLYGLKPEYLRILGIEPPICNWVCVENFRCDKSELRDVLEMAGYVVVCSVIYCHQKHAKVMYSHPLEAVQAISMLNKQTFYGRALSVTMIRYPLDGIILPKALPTVGPGFGTYGKPLRDIVKHYERFVNKEPNSLNNLLFHDPNNSQDNKEMTDESVEIVDRSKDEIYEKYQFSKQFVIQYVEDDSEDTRSGSKNSSYTGTDNQKFDEPRKTSLPQYSPRSPTHSPLSEINRKSVSTSDEVPKIMKTKIESGSIYSWEKASTATDQSGPSMGPSGGPVGSVGPVSGQSNNRLPTPIGQRTIPGPNVATGPVGLRYVFNPANPMAGSGYRPNVSISGPNIPVILSQQTKPNPMSGPGYRPNVLMTVPNGPGIRANMPMCGHNMVPGQVTIGLRPQPPAAHVAPAQTSRVVQFRNLPPTTTFAILSEKMSQCGQLLSVQLTTPGCATVSFSHPAHALACFQRFNNCCVDGCVIQARLV